MFSGSFQKKGILSNLPEKQNKIYSVESINKPGQTPWLSDDSSIESNQLAINSVPFWKAENFPFIYAYNEYELLDKLNSIFESAHFENINYQKVKLKIGNEKNFYHPQFALIFPKGYHFGLKSIALASMSDLGNAFNIFILSQKLIFNSMPDFNLYYNKDSNSLCFKTITSFEKDNTLIILFK